MRMMRTMEAADATATVFFFAAATGGAPPCQKVAQLLLAGLPAPEAGDSSAESQGAEWSGISYSFSTCFGHLPGVGTASFRGGIRSLALSKP